MKRRSAATLVEVLVAIFVTAIGLLALLALFPLGALTMAQAIKDDRTAHAAGNAAAVGESLPQWGASGFATVGVRSDPLIYDPTMPPFDPNVPGSGRNQIPNNDLRGYISPVTGRSIIDPVGFNIAQFFPAPTRPGYRRGRCARATSG